MNFYVRAPWFIIVATSNFCRILIHSKKPLAISDGDRLREGVGAAGAGAQVPVRVPPRPRQRRRTPQGHVQALRIPQVQ